MRALSLKYFWFKKGWGLLASDKFEGSKQVYSIGALQDGRFLHGLVKPADWLTKLDWKDVYFLVLIDPIHQISMEECDIPISLPSV